MTRRAALLAAWLLTAAAPAALAQGTTSEKPLLPPPSALAAPRPAHRPVAHPLPLVKPPHAAVKKPAAEPAPARHAPVKPAAKLPVKPAPAHLAPAHPGKVAPKPVTKAPPPKQAAPAAAPAPAKPPPRIDPNKGTTTGRPLPRWAAFRSDEVNLRSGPGMQYPIQWVYHRRDLPVRILREFEVWRLIQEADGTKGWVHEATLTGRRGFVVQGGEQVLRASPADTADSVARVEEGVVGYIRRCPAASDWCDVQAGKYRGWLKRSALYGVSPGEAIE